MSTVEAEALERAAWAGLDTFPLEPAMDAARRAVALREAAQGPDHPDVIWPLSLWIAALLRDHDPASARQACQLGLRRLKLREAALHAFPQARAHAIREQIGLCAFEGEVFDAALVRALEAVLRGYPPAGGTDGR